MLSKHKQKKIKMKKLLFIFTLTLLFACGYETKRLSNDIPTATIDPNIDYLIQNNSIGQLVAINHQKIKDLKGDFKSFKNYIDKLDNDSLTSIPFALDYIKTCIPIESANLDSAFLLFNIKFYTIVNKLTVSIDTKYKTIMGQFANDSNTVELKSFKDNLAACGVDILSSEGMYYLDVVSDFFYENFKNRVSPGVAGFLFIRKDELKQGFSEDAGLVISFDELYGRIKSWERFINKFPNTIFKEEANSYYQMYLSTLITGMDNSRVFDGENNSISPEIKTLYEKIITEDIESPTTKIMSSYYSFLARHDFKENDSSQLILNAINLSTMLAVQPPTR